jgi:hypothetical protein
MQTWKREYFNKVFSFFVSNGWSLPVTSIREIMNPVNAGQFFNS